MKFKKDRRAAPAQPMQPAQPRPKKSLGQHFLRDARICAHIAALLGVCGADAVMEIGPGPGALTRQLAALPARKFLLLEKDAHWAAERERELRKLADGGHIADAEVLNIDALRFPWADLRGRWKIAGNLPYNIASPLIWDILSQCKACAGAVFMVQKEVALRICARPHSRAYGALSVWAQCHSAPKLEFCLKPGAFTPPPKVDSAVVSFAPLPQKPEHPAQLAQVLKICFQMRRKQLGSIARNLPPLMRGLETCGIDASLRPENLACADFLALARHWSLLEEKGLS